MNGQTSSIDLRVQVIGAVVPSVALGGLAAQRLACSLSIARARA
jgi:hypothetical protein